MVCSTRRAVLAVLLLLALVATACGGDADDTAEDTADDTATDTGADDPADEPADDTADEPDDEAAEDTADTEEEPADAGDADATFAFSVSDDPGELNPASGSRTVAVNLFRFLYDPLVRSSPDGTIVSGLATSWEVADNVVTFQIADDVTCSDGSPVTATTIADHFEWLKDPANGSTLIGIALPNADFEVAADEASNTFTLTLGEPYQFILPALEFLPVPCGEAGADPSTLVDTASGTGPYTLTEVVPDDHYTLTRRDDYAWGPDGATTEGAPQTIIMRIVSSETTAANLMTTGELTASAINGPDRQRLLAEGMQETTYISGGAQMMFSQADGHVTADPNVRLAVAHAIDRAQMATVLTQGLSAETAFSLAPAQPQSCVDAAAEAAIPAHDPDAAIALLEESGWEEGDDGIRVKDGERLSLDTPFLETYPGNQPAAELMAEQLAAVGIEAVLRPVTQGTLSETIFSTGDYDVWPTLALSVPFQSALLGILGGPFPPDGINGGRVDNTEFEELAAEANRLTGEEGCQGWIEAEMALFAAADVVPIAGVVTNWVTDDATFDTMQGRIIPTSIRVTG